MVFRSRTQVLITIFIGLLLIIITILGFYYMVKSEDNNSVNEHPTEHSTKKHIIVHKHKKKRSEKKKGEKKTGEKKTVEKKSGEKQSSEKKSGNDLKDKAKESPSDNDCDGNKKNNQGFFDDNNHKNNLITCVVFGTTYLISLSGQYLLYLIPFKLPLCIAGLATFGYKWYYINQSNT